jgi:hypothetical protein
MPLTSVPASSTLSCTRSLLSRTRASGASLSGASAFARFCLAFMMSFLQLGRSDSACVLVPLVGDALVGDGAEIARRAILLTAVRDT